MPLTTATATITVLLFKERGAAALDGSQPAPHQNQEEDSSYVSIAVIGGSAIFMLCFCNAVALVFHRRQVSKVRLLNGSVNVSADVNGHSAMVKLDHDAAAVLVCNAQAGASADADQNALPTLRAIALGGDQIQDTAAKHLEEAICLRDERVLDELYDNHQIGEEGLRFLAAGACEEGILPALPHLRRKQDRS